MAQGPLKTKKPTVTSSSSRSHHAAPSKKHQGSRIIKPKKPTLISKQKLLKKHTAGLTALTERNLAARAGHLELLAGGKKGGDDGQEKAKAKANAKGGKSGAKKS